MQSSISSLLIYKYLNILLLLLIVLCAIIIFVTRVNSSFQSSKNEKVNVKDFLIPIGFYYSQIISTFTSM